MILLLYVNCTWGCDASTLMCIRGVVSWLRCRVRIDVRESLCIAPFLREPESLSSLVNCQEQLLSKHLIGRVLWQVDLVEACANIQVGLVISTAQDPGTYMYALEVVGQSRRRPYG